jgi:uncharacterized damage-inducible protein DinB
MKNIKRHFCRFFYFTISIAGMNTTLQIAKHLRDVHFGGNWTTSNLRDQLKDITWEQATTQVYSLNTIATLTYHIHYYIPAITKVLQGEPLVAKDEYSFAHPPINSQQDWENFLLEVWAAAETLATLIEQLPDSKLSEDFADAKYGTYFRNLHGLIEHTHYHLGQIALIKKIIQQKEN